MKYHIPCWIWTLTVDFWPLALPLLALKWSHPARRGWVSCAELVTLNAASGRSDQTKCHCGCQGTPLSGLLNSMEGGVTRVGGSGAILKKWHCVALFGAYSPSKTSRSAYMVWCRKMYIRESSLRQIRYSMCLSTEASFFSVSFLGMVVYIVRVCFGPSESLWVLVSAQDSDTRVRCHSQDCQIAGLSL